MLKETLPSSPEVIQEVIPGLAEQLPSIQDIKAQMRLNPPAIPPAIYQENDSFARCGADVYAMFWEIVRSTPELSHLWEFPVSLLFKKEGKRTRKEGVKFTAGMAKLFSAADAVVHGYCYQVWVDETLWLLCPDKRMPLLLHELLHCGLNDKGMPCMVEHDLQEFNLVANRYKNWTSDVKQFVAAAAGE